MYKESLHLHALGNGIPHKKPRGICLGVDGLQEGADGSTPKSAQVKSKGSIVYLVQDAAPFQNQWARALQRGASTQLAYGAAN